MSEGVRLVASAVIEWEGEHGKQYLTDPDPRKDHLQLDVRDYESSSNAFFFEIQIPVWSLTGVDCKTVVFLRIYANSIISLESETFPQTPEAVNKKLSCSTVCLRFHLLRPITIIVPTAANVPLQTKRKPSGEVLDALRSLARVTTLGIYLPDTQLPKVKLEAIQEAISRARARPFVHSQDDMASLYNGTGGKIVHIPSDDPPSYDQVEPPPPMAPIQNDKKRRRQESVDLNSTDALKSVWAELARMHEIQKRSQERIDQLEGAVSQLRERNKHLEDKLKQLDDEKDQLRLECDKTNEQVEIVDSELLPIKQRLDDLEDDVHDLKESGVEADVEERIVETVTDRVLGEMSAEAYNATVTFTRK